VVQKIVESTYPGPVEKVEISVAAAEDLFREIRIENTFIDIDGQLVALKHGARVDVTFEADTNDTVKKGAAARS